MPRSVGARTGAVALFGLAAAFVYLGHSTTPTATLRTAPEAPPGVEASAPASVPGTNVDDADESHVFRPPSGQPSSLGCVDARHILRQVHGALAYAPHPVAPAAFATAVADWLDPHGLWSASPDSPVPAALALDAARLLQELEANDASPCAASSAVGAVLAVWTRELVKRFDVAFQKAASSPPASIRDALRDADEPVVDDTLRPAREQSTRLGERTGRVSRRVGPTLAPYVEAARARLFPPLDAEGWAGVVRAAAVRAYVQLIDPHGAWAPTDEEASVYDVDLDPEPPERLWEDGMRTVLGVRVDTGPVEPLEVGDVVLSVAGVSTAGLPLEQLDQLVYATTDAPVAAPLVVLRGTEVRSLVLPAPAAGSPREEEVAPLYAYRVPYGVGEVLVVEIHDVRSDLGDALAHVLRQETAPPVTSPIALAIDLRDDGGGSTEGAIAALGLFLPGAPLFPMARRDGSVEVDRAPEPPVSERWVRPVATLVDGDTASAAEMIAGALQAYHRGPVVGQRTYGKGCAQEYLDDVSHKGVLRLTTLLYALPDGSPVQGVGLEPSLLLTPPDPAPRDHVALSGAPVALAQEREADQPNAPPTWRGPDVRDSTLVLPASSGGVWPEHGGAVGPCKDAIVCQALRALGGGSGKRSRAAVTPAPPANGSR